MKREGWQCAFKRGLAGLASVGAVLAGRGSCAVRGDGASVYLRGRGVDGQDADAAHRRQLGGLHAVLQRSRARVRRRPGFVPVRVGRRDRRRPGARRSRRPDRLGCRVRDQEPDAARLLGAATCRSPAPARASTTRTWRSRTTWSSPARTRASASSTSRTRPTRSQIVNYTGCNVGQGDVIVYGNLLIRSWDPTASATSTCAGQLVGQGFEGIHIFDISNPAAAAVRPRAALRATTA